MIRIIEYVIMGIAGVINFYLVFTLVKEKKMIEKNNDYQVKNNKFIILIIFNFILYIIYGLMRNFE